MVIIEPGWVYYQLFYISVGQKSPIGTFVLQFLFSHQPIWTTSRFILYVCMVFFFCISPFQPLSSHLFISSHHWSSQVHTGSVTSALPPVAASHLSVMSLFTRANCAQYLTHGEELRFILRFLRLNKKWSSLSGSFCLFVFFWFFCIPSQIIHPSPTCSWSYTHTAATTWAYGNWVSIVCVCT